MGSPDGAKRNPGPPVPHSASLHPGYESEIGSSTRLRLASFARTLRHNGFRVGLAETRDALSVLASPAAARPSSLQSALRALFCATHSDWEKFDAIFTAFWRGRHMRTARALSGAVADSDKVSPRRVAPADPRQSPSRLLDQAARGEGEAGGESRPEGASSAENLAATDLRHVTDPADIARAHDLAARLARTMRARLVRRQQVRAGGRRLDLRRTIHRNIAHGGTPIELVWRRRKDRPLRLVILLDASGSMSLYTAFFVRFCMAWSMRSARPRPSCFTRASHMSRRRCATAT
jgi:uncharacterized protein with von Willebrand factor type A (vWA) domain